MTNTNEAHTCVIEELRKAAAFRYEEGMKLSRIIKLKTWVHTPPNHPADCNEKSKFLALTVSRGLELSREIIWVITRVMTSDLFGPAPI